MSYYRVLGLDREPFSTSPDPAFFYQSPKHRAALANLVIEFRLRRGFSVVLGDIGTGKTTLGRKLVQMLKERERFIFHMVLDPTYPSEDLFFSALIRTFGIELPLGVVAPTLLDHREALERFLFRKGVQERHVVVLIIDEAHKLHARSLEFLRILLNYETNDAKLLQLVLLGQMELWPLLANMPNLEDRISLKCLLKPFSLAETREMVAFRLHEAGYRSSSALFSDDAVAAIHEYGEGYPRRIAMLCHRTLRTLAMRHGQVADRALIDEFIRQDIEAGWHQAERLPQSPCSV